MIILLELKMTEENELQEINITDLWNKNLFDSLQRLQDFERICRDGAVSIGEYLNISPQRLPEIQFQYLKMMVSELGILLGNAKARIGKTFFLKAKVQLRSMKKIVDMEPQLLLVSSTNQQTHATQNYLSNNFYSFLFNLTQIREGIIDELRDILFGSQTEKASGMDKKQGLIR